MAAVPVADALEDILQSGLAFPGTLEPLACWQEWCDGHLCLSHHPPTRQCQHWAQPGPQPAPVTPSTGGPRAQPLSAPTELHPAAAAPIPCRGAQKAPSGRPTPFLGPAAPTRKAQLLRGATDCKLPGRLGCQTNIFLFTTEHKYLAAHLI